MTPAGLGTGHKSFDANTLRAQRVGVPFKDAKERKGQPREM